MAVTTRDIVAQAIKELPPLLEEDDTTVKKCYEEHREELTSQNEARLLLDALVEAGKLVKVECRVGGKGGRVMAYRVKK